MKNPFTEDDYKLIDEAVKNREEFQVKKTFPYDKGGKYEITIEGMKMDEYTYKLNQHLWGEPYSVHWDEYHVGKGGSGYADRVDYVEKLGAREYIAEQTKHLDFEEIEEQMRWF